MRLTKKRLDMINRALGYWETELIENEAWRSHFATEADAQATLKGARAWVWEQLMKRDTTDREVTA